MATLGPKEELNKMPLTTTRKKRRHGEMGGSGDAAPNTTPPRRSSTSPFKKDKEAILEMCRAEKQELLLELKVHSNKLKYSSHV